MIIFSISNVEQEIPRYGWIYGTKDKKKWKFFFNCRKASHQKLWEVIILGVQKKDKRNNIQINCEETLNKGKSNGKLN